MSIYRIPGIAGRIIARQRQAPPEVKDRSVEEMRAILTQASVKVHRNWGAKRLAEEVAKLKAD